MDETIKWIMIIAGVVAMAFASFIVTILLLQSGEITHLQQQAAAFDQLAKTYERRLGRLEEAFFSQASWPPQPGEQHP